MDEQTAKRFAVLTAAAGLSTWAIDMAATQVGLPSMQAALGVSVTASQWILNLTLMILAGIVTVGGALGDRLGRLRMFRLGIIGIIAGAVITFGGGAFQSAEHAGLDLPGCNPGDIGCGAEAAETHHCAVRHS